MIRREIKFEAELNGLITARGYSRNRQPILDSVGVTAAALSQYVRGRTRPSFHKLVALADFFGVSLDHLVFGEPASTPVDHNPIARYVEQALLDAQTRANQHSELVARIGRLLADRINDVADGLISPGNSGSHGLISLQDTIRIERFSRQADIIATDLGPNIITMADGETAPGQFFQVVVRNLARGCRYRFLLAGELTLYSAALSRLKDMIISAVGEESLRANCHFRRTAFPVVGGLGLYKLDTQAFRAADPELYTQFSKYLLEDSWFGYIFRSNDDSPTDIPMSSDYTERARGTFETLWSATDPQI